MQCRINVRNCAMAWSATALDCTALIELHSPPSPPGGCWGIMHRPYTHITLTDYLIAPARVNINGRNRARATKVGAGCGCEGASAGLGARGECEKRAIVQTLMQEVFSGHTQASERDQCRTLTCRRSVRSGGAAECSATALSRISTPDSRQRVQVGLL